MDAMIENQARKYLARVVPFDGTSHIGIHYTSQKPGYAKPVWYGKPALNLDQAITQLEWISKQPETLDIYVSMASQRETDTRTSAAGHKFKVARREASNAVMLRSLFLDIDVKDKGYATPQEAVTALGKLIADTGLPKPTAVVASGSGGLHVYWVLVDALTPAEWQPLANALAAAATKSGLKFDSQCTVDSVRILRIPGTFNFKNGGKAPVELKILRETDVPNEKITAALAPYIGVQTPAGGNNRNMVGPAKLGSGVASVNDELSGGITTGAAPRNIDAVASQCAFIWDTLNDGGATHSNPLWFLTLRIATFCQDPDMTGHRLSQGHPGYLHAETQQELDRLTKERTTKPNIGFPSCATIQATGATQCATCPHLALGKSPLSLPNLVFTPPGNINVPAVQHYALLPDGYSFDPIGRVVHNTVDDQGIATQRLVFDYPIRDPWVTKHPWILNFTTTCAGGEDLEIDIPFGALDKSIISKTLMDKGLPCNVDKPLQDFIVSFLKQLRDSAHAVIEAQPFGWNFARDGTITGFTYGGSCWSAQGDKPAAQPDPALRRIYSPRGASAHWHEAAKIITDQKRPALDCILASAFAAPLVRFTGHNGLTLGAFSPESGVGKSTTLAIAQAVWGHPVEGMGGLNDTITSLFIKAGQLRHLLLAWDEIKTAKQTADFVNMIFRMSGGKDTARAKRNATLQEAKTWHTLLAYCSNESLYDAVARATRTTTAGHMRMFEFAVPPSTMPPSDTVMMQRLVGTLTSNYGHAGIEYAKYLGSNYGTIDTQIESVSKKLSQITSAGNDERFWIATMATIIVGANISNQLGLTSFDELGLRKFLCAEFARMRTAKDGAANDMSKAINVIAILGAYLAEKRADHTLVTDKIWVIKGKPGKNAIIIEGDGSARVDRLRSIDVQIGREMRMLRLADAPLGDWLKMKEISKSSFLAAMKDKLGATSTFGRMGSGTRLAGVTESLWQISWAGTELEDNIEW